MVKVNIDTGLPSDGSPEETILEAFIEGTAPAEKGEQETKEPSSDTPPGVKKTEDPSPSPNN
jgi:hypothetical protein